MSREHKAALVFVSLWSAALACSQAAAPPAAPASAPLSGPLRDHVKSGRFQLVTSVRGLPLGVRDAMQTLFGSETLDIAEPTGKFQVDDLVVNPNLPNRRMAAAACSYDYCLVYYERGGADHTWRAALFHWTPAETRFEWGGIAPDGLATIDDVRNAILSGAIKGPAPFW